MANSESLNVALGLASGLAGAETESQAAAAIARAAGQLTGAESVRVWILDRNRGYRFSGTWPEDSERPEEPSAIVARVVAFGTPDCSAAEPPFRSRLTLPLLAGLRPLGAIVLLEGNRPAGPFTEADAEQLSALVQAADVGLQSVRERVVQDRGKIEAITRLTRLFDMVRTFAATLEMDDLTTLVVNRVQNAFDVEAAYLWLVDEDGAELALSAAMAPFPESVIGWKLEVGQGVAGQAIELGETVRYDDPDEIPLLDERPDNDGEQEVWAVAAVPITTPDDEVHGVLEIVNPTSEQGFDAADLAMLREAAEATAIAIDNARRLDAERRASDLSALLHAAQQLGAHLDVQKVTFALVHQAASVIAYKRSAVALLRGGRFELAAVSGQTIVDEKHVEIKPLADILRWAINLDDGTYIVQEEDGTIDAERAETREKFEAYFEASGCRSFLIVPLKDDEGKIGVFALESGETYGFSERDLEAAGLLGVQAASAIRNALLYARLPMAKVFQPLAAGTDRWMSKSGVRRYGRLGVAAAILAALIFLPLPLRVGGRVELLPERRLPITAQVDGRVAETFVREGDLVTRGQTLAIIDDREFLVAHEEAESRYEVALREQSRLRAGGLAAEAAMGQARLEGLHAELNLSETRLERTRLVSTIDGVVSTPHVEDLVGTALSKGQTFCEVIDPARQVVEVAVSERDGGLLAVGMPVKVKLNAYPTRSFHGTVEQIGVAAVLRDDDRLFLVRLHIDPEDVVLRSGMTGKAKINTGPAPLGRVIFRKPARWLWSILWGWLP